MVRNPGMEEGLANKLAELKNFLALLADAIIKHRDGRLRSSITALAVCSGINVNWSVM